MESVTGLERRPASREVRRRALKVYGSRAQLLVGRAAAFAFAGVFAFAIVIGGLAAALTFAGIHSLAGVLGHGGGIAGGSGAHRTAGAGVVTFTSEVGGGCPGDQAGHGGRGEDTGRTSAHSILLPKSSS